MLWLLDDDDVENELDELESAVSSTSKLSSDPAIAPWN